MAIRRPTGNYNSDFLSREVDDELEDLEKRLSKMYSRAKREITDTYRDYANEFREADDQMRELVEAGKMTSEQYIVWRQNRVLQSARYMDIVMQMSEMLTKTDSAAMAVISDTLPFVIAESYNFVEALGWANANDAGYSFGTFEIYNARAVQALIRDNPRLLPQIDISEDMLWNMNHINNEITQGILQGESIPKIANRLIRVTTMDENSAIRNARTSMTYAENLGRDEAYEHLKNMGMPIRKRWNAVVDERTRDTHKKLNGTFADEETGLFGTGILAHPLRCPADPTGDPWEIYNCRCREGVVFDNEFIDHSQDGQMYEDFLKQNYPDDYEKLLDRDYFNQHQTTSTSIPAPTPTPAPAPAVPAPEQTPIPAPAPITAEETTWATASNREEARKLLEDMGFSDISSGLDKMNEEVLLNTVNQLSKLNTRFGAIPDNAMFSTGSMKNGCAYVAIRGNSAELKLNTKFFSSTSDMIANTTSMQDINFWMPTSDEYKSLYIITHEYGHLLQNKILDTEALTDTMISFMPDIGRGRHRREIMEIAMERTGKTQLDITTEYASQYSLTNDAEFFAEVFMNSQCGKPNVLGEAMNIWLGRRGL